MESWKGERTQRGKRDRNAISLTQPLGDELEFTVDEKKVDLAFSLERGRRLSANRTSCARRHGFFCNGALFFSSLFHSGAAGLPRNPLVSFDSFFEVLIGGKHQLSLMGGQ